MELLSNVVSVNIFKKEKKIASWKYVWSWIIYIKDIIVWLVGFRKIYRICCCISSAPRFRCLLNT